MTPIRRLLIIILLLFLGACQAAEPVPPALTRTPENSPIPPATLTETPTETPIPETSTPAPTATSTLTPTPEIVDYGPVDFPPDVNPLTGLRVSDPTVLQRRPVAVKIQTFPRGQRPPWAISLADIVFNFYQNNGLTRLHALFLTHDAEQVGPIRSARYLDGTLVRMYGSLFAFGGADHRILNRLMYSEYADRLITEGANLCPAMCRIEPNSYNYLVANTLAIHDYAREQVVDDTMPGLEGMTFQTEPPAGGVLGTQAAVRYSISSYNRWDFDSVSGRYLRFADTQEDTGQGEGYAPFIDRLTNRQVSADNVVIIMAIHEYVYRSGNSEIIDILLSGSGTAYAFRDGQMYSVVWNRPAPESILYLTDANGNPFPFKQGTTWFEIVGQSVAAQDQGDGGWRFEHRFP